MNYKLCPLYGLQSKTMLKRLLRMSDSNYFKAANFAQYIIPYIDNTNPQKPRLIEAPKADLKRVQSVLLAYLKKIDVPFYVFSGVEHKCFIDNAKIHRGSRYLYKIDISKFFPSISRDKIYKFFYSKLSMSPDVADVVTNICSINYKYFVAHKNYQEVQAFMRDKKIKEQTHLITGAPVSSLLSYLANIPMFDELYKRCTAENIAFSIYVDDMVFSADHEISPVTIVFIKSTIKKYGYNLSDKKCRYYKPYMSKKITGVVLNKHGSVTTPNSLIYKTHARIRIYKNDKSNKINIASLKGCIVAANCIDGRFPCLKKVVFSGENKKNA